MEKSRQKRNKKAEIIETAYKLIGREGLERATIRRIAEIMDVTPSLLFHYYNSKDELLYDVMEYVINKFENIYRDVLTDTSDSKERLIWFLDKEYNLEVFEAVDSKVYYAFFWLSFSNKKILEGFEQIYERIQEVTKTLIDDYLYDYGLLNINSELLSCGLVAQWDGLHSLHVVYGGTGKFLNYMYFMKDKTLKELRLD